VLAVALALGRVPRVSFSEAPPARPSGTRSMSLAGSLSVAAFSLWLTGVLVSRRPLLGPCSAQQGVLDRAEQSSHLSGVQKSESCFLLPETSAKSWPRRASTGSATAPTCFST